MSSRGDATGCWRPGTLRQVSGLDGVGGMGTRWDNQKLAPEGDPSRLRSAYGSRRMILMGGRILRVLFQRIEDGGLEYHESDTGPPQVANGHQIRADVARRFGMP